MKVFRVKLVVCTLASLLIYMWPSACMAFPLPTADWKRLGDSAKQAMQIAKQVQIEVQSNMYIIKQIQNGGYAAAAGELFGKIARGDYDRYGQMFADSKQVLKDGAEATKKKKEEDAKIQEKNQEIQNKIDIVYIDPPYKTDFVYESVKKIIEKDLLSKDGTIIIETDEEERITKQIENLNIKIENQRRYGRVHLIFIKIR